MSDLALSVRFVAACDCIPCTGPQARACGRMIGFSWRRGRLRRCGLSHALSLASLDVGIWLVRTIWSWVARVTVAALLARLGLHLELIRWATKHLLVSPGTPP